MPQKTVECKAITTLIDKDGNTFSASATATASSNVPLATLKNKLSSNIENIKKNNFNDSTFSDANDIAIKLASELSLLEVLKNVDSTMSVSNHAISNNPSSNDYTTHTEVSTTETTPITWPYTYPWITQGTELSYFNNLDQTTSNIQLKGVSLTSTEYMAAVFANSSFYDFGYYTWNQSTNSYYNYYQNGNANSYGNPGLTLNAYYLYQCIKNIQENKTLNPIVRIPITADYWLNGTGGLPTVNSYSDPTYTQGQTNIKFTGQEYQQAITDLIYYLYESWNTDFNPLLGVFNSI